MALKRLQCDRPSEMRRIAHCLAFAAAGLVFSSPADTQSVYRLNVTAERGGKVVTWGRTAGIDCGSDCEETFAAPTSIGLQAVPDPGFAFLAWGGDCSSTNEFFGLAVNGPSWCGAVFTPSIGSTVEPADVATLYINAEWGEPMSAERSFAATSSSSSFAFGTSTPSALDVSVTVPAPNSTTRRWDLSFGAPAGQVLVPGRAYESLFRQQEATPMAARLRVQWASSPWFCNEIRGRFVIHELVFAPGGAVAAFAADFEQHCDQSPGGLRGSIRYQSARAQLTPYPGEGRTKLMFRHRTTGEILMWPLGGVTRLAFLPSSPARAGVNWRLAGFGDVDRDGNADFIWQEETTGELIVWFMQRYSLTRSSFSNFSVPGPSDPAWKVVAVGDINGDTRDDLFWQHETSGALAAWLLDGLTVTSRVSLIPDRPLDTNWRVAALADFNGDGKPDILWKHRLHGYLVVWIMDGVARTSTVWLNPGQLADPAWHVAATADINGDGKTDIVFQHPTEGHLAVWLMDGVNRLEYQMLNPGRVLDTDWRIVGRRLGPRYRVN